jgi:hypothetical protein
MGTSSDSGISFEMIQRAVFYFKIGSIPVLAIVGYMIITRGWNWLMPDHNEWLASRGYPLVNPAMAVFTVVVMTFVGIFYCVALKYSKPPSGFMGLFAGVIQLGLIVLATRHFLPADHPDPQNEFWRWILNALVIESNAILISAFFMKLFNPGFTIAGSDHQENNIVFGYLFVSLALFNVTTYGLFFWRSLAAADLTSQIALIGITLAASVSYFLAYRAPIDSAGSAESVSPEPFVILTLTGTWGMLLVVYPLAGVITVVVKNWPK